MEKIKVRRYSCFGNSDIFAFEDILMDILKGLCRHIYNEKGQIRCLNFSFLVWGLRVTYNSDIFEKFRPPP